MEILPRLSRALARDILGEKGNRTISQMVGDGISRATNGFVSPKVGKEAFHAGLIFFGLKYLNKNFIKMDFVRKNCRFFD